MVLSDRRSIVAIDATTRGLAFVFFENGELLDWGERVRSTGEELGAVDALIDGCAADVLVIEDPDAPGCKRRPRVRELLRQIARHARRRSVTIVLVSRAEARKAWGERGLRNKEAIAAAVATRFSELSAIVPPRRKPGWNEDPRVNIFDAASLVLHHDETFRARPFLR
jgi:hypothetical protein